MTDTFLSNSRLWGALALSFMLGCASELSENETMERIRRELQQTASPLAIAENRQLSQRNRASVYANKQNAAQSDLPVFEAERATGNVVNPNAQRPKRVSGNAPGTVTLNFENADLREVVKFIMTDLLAKNYILSPAVQGQVTLQTSEPIAVDNLLPTLESLLKLNGAVMVSDGDLLRILPIAEANRGNLAPKVGKIRRLKPGYEVRIIPLKYLSATEAQKNLEPFLPAGSLIQVDPVKNILTVAGTSTELANIQQTINTFDVDWLKGMSIGVYRLQNVSLEEVLPEIEGLFGQGGSTPFAGLFQFIAMDRLNAVMVITRQASYLGEARRWLEKLDKADGGDKERLYVYRVQNGRAEDLAGVLGGIFSSKKQSGSTRTRTAEVAPGQTGATASSKPTDDNKPKGNNAVAAQAKNKAAKVSSQRSGTSISGAEATISADEVNNSLVIKATPGNYDLVLQALRQLDVPKLQVMLDIVVAEINLSGSLSLGFNYWLQETEQKDDNQGITFGGVGASAINGVEGGFAYTLNNVIPGRLNVAINALAKNGLAQFLSTPSLMVLDNETATMNVGEKISISNNYTDANGNAVNGTSYLDTGVNLSITPRVTAGGSVQMNITQTVSRQATTTGAQGNPNVYTRDINSAVVANDGQTIVLGGLIQENTDTNRSGVPLLQDLPAVGSLFRTTKRSKSRTELIVLITPHVARNADETLRITKAFRNRMKGLDIYNESRGKYH